MTALYAASVAAGGVLCAVALVWAARTRHVRKVWRAARHQAGKVAIVLELEECVRQVEATAPAR
jgi:hypothetical protein